MTSLQSFDKSHLEYSTLVSHMRHLGLSIDDDDEAHRILSTIGYHRLGGYRYPFRRLLAPEQQRPQWHEWRSDTYMDGARFDDVVALERFDDALRTLLLEGLFTFEIGLRNAISHVVGRTTLLGYMDESFLDATTCAELITVDGEKMTKLDSWTASINESVERALKSENDAVLHHIHKYGAPVPIWTAMEILSFGKLPFFLEMVSQQTLNEVASVFGLRQGQRLRAWVFALGDLRNLSAHGARVWNRQMKRPLKVISAAVDDRLLHLAADTHNDLQPRRLYQVSAALAYCLQSLDNTSDWPQRFTRLLDAFPSLTIKLDPLESMGIPAGWHAERLWSRENLPAQFGDDANPA